MFDKLAHASIMRLNSNSMDKLYDLMTMAVKYQVTKDKKKTRTRTKTKDKKKTGTKRKTKTSHTT